MSGLAKMDSEQQIFLRHRNGDPEAFAEFVQAYRAPVFAYLTRCAVTPADRDDLFQDVFIRIHRARDQYSADRPLHPWIFTIVANVVRTYHGRRKKLALVHARIAEQSPPGRDNLDGEQVAAARQTAAWLEGAIRTLAPLQREALLLTCVENIPQKDAAAALGLPLNTLKTHLRRARLALLDALERRNSVGDGKDSP